MKQIILHPSGLKIFKNLAVDEEIKRKIIEVSSLNNEELSEWLSSRPELQLEEINDTTLKRIIRPIKVLYNDYCLYRGLNPPFLKKW